MLRFDRRRETDADRIVAQSLPDMTDKDAARVRELLTPVDIQSIVLKLVTKIEVPILEIRPDASRLDQA